MIIVFGIGLASYFIRGGAEAPAEALGVIKRIDSARSTVTIQGGYITDGKSPFSVFPGEEIIVSYGETTKISRKTQTLFRNLPPDKAIVEEIAGVSFSELVADWNKYDKDGRSMAINVKGSARRNKITASEIVFTIQITNE